MKSITKNIPNAITCLNLFAGCLACVMAFRGEFVFASYFVIAAAIFDFLDGFAARLLKAYSPLGKELDSLADLVSFGMAPAFMIFSFLLQHVDICWAISAFLIPVFSALRLAKFNIDERQSSSFIGLPTPANAIFWVFLISDINQHFPIIISVIELKIIASAFIVLFSYLLVSEIPMFSLKVKNLSWADNKIQFVFLVGSFALMVVLQFSAFPFIVGFYILLSLLNWAYHSLYVKSRKKV